MLVKSLSFIVLLALLSACNSNTPPQDAFKLSATSIDDKHMQTRKYDTLKQSELLSASAGVLQDLGYTLEESNSVLGVLSASKMIDATDAGQVVGAVLIAIFTGSVNPVDDKQKITVCLVVNTDLSDEASSLARLTIQRQVWDTQGRIVKSHTVKEAELYTAFFSKLSKAVFLEANSI